MLQLGSQPLDENREIHSGCQWQSLITPVLATALGVKEEQVTIRAYMLGGGFGRRLNDDYTIPAALASKALGGKPVKMVMSRSQDMQFDSPRSASVQQLKMAFDADKRVIATEPHATAGLSLIHISEPTRLGMISYAVFCLKKKNTHLRAHETRGNLVCRLLLEKKKKKKKKYMLCAV